MPSSHLPVARTDSLPQVSVDSCLLQVIMWNPNWLNEYGMLYFYLFIFYVCVYIFAEFSTDLEILLSHNNIWLCQVNGYVAILHLFLAIDAANNFLHSPVCAVIFSRLICCFLCHKIFVL